MLTYSMEFPLAREARQIAKQFSQCWKMDNYWLNSESISRLTGLSHHPIIEL
jgi:hypothetical protein